MVHPNINQAFFNQPDYLHQQTPLFTIFADYVNVHTEPLSPTIV